MKLQPLHSDERAKNDLLDRKRFAKNISASILNHVQTKEESLIIGLHGAWGSGKSTLLDFIKGDIVVSEYYLNAQKVEKKKYRILNFIRKCFGRKQEKESERKLFLLEFNPWMFSGKEHLHRIFLSDFARKVGSKTHGLRDKIKEVAKGFSWIDSITGASAVSKLLDSFAEISIEELQEETNKLLITNNIHVVIIMDDLDRLAPSEVLEVFQLVKLNANFKNTLFLLSFDKSIVKNSIASQYKFDGERYLEKIIQVDYSLPSVLPEEMESMFFNRLQEFLDAHEIDFDITSLNTAWLFNGLRQYFSNIRDLNRYFNSLSFRLPPIHKDINVHDFILIEVLRLFDFNTYEIIKNNYKESLQFGPDSYYKKELKTIIGKSLQLYNYLINRENQSVKLKYNEYRIFSTDSFDRYFSLNISKKDINEDDFRNFVHHPPARHQMLETAIKQGKIEYLLRRLGGQSDFHTKMNLSDSIRPLLSVWVGYNNELANNWRNVWTAIKNLAFTHTDKREGVLLILNQINASTSEFSPARFIFLWLIIQSATEEDFKNIDPDLEPYRELIKEELNRLEQTWVMLLKNQQAFFLFGDTYPVLFERIFLQSFAKYLPEDYERQFKQLIVDNQKIFKILNMFLHRDSESQEPFGIDQKHIGRLLPGDLKQEFITKLKTLNQKALSEHDAKAVNAFLYYISNGVDPLIGRRKDL